MPGTSRETYVSDTRRVLDRIEGVFDSVWMPDHFRVNDMDCFECWTTLTFFAGLYPRLQFGTIVLCNSFRNPGLLAKMAATLQCLTDGRLVLGIGSGWNEAEYRAFGYEFPRAGTRIDQLDEALQVITSLWREPSATFAGRHYQITDARCEPRPSVPPTLMVGGKGPRTLRLAARYAD
jgi:alkanesulfonate monooxygenase SsuD/methylene tetrahydromethanopterin reductase-like flavin-dependent oxidoreductase (luciferase family)